MTGDMNLFTQRGNSIILLPYIFYLRFNLYLGEQDSFLCLYAHFVRAQFTKFQSEIILFLNKIVFIELFQILFLGY